MSAGPVYLDCNATTPMEPAVAEIVRRYFEEEYGNEGSRTHNFGARARQAVQKAREQIAALVDAKPEEVVFTSGATESNNLAILGLAHWGRQHGKTHIISTRIEHKAVLDSCHHLETEGFELTLLAPRPDGLICPESLAAAIREDTILVSLMHVNNELGTINDIAALGAICRARGVLFHVDAAQSAGKIPLDLAGLPVDLASFSAHKLYGPKGIGALYVRRQPRAWLDAQIHGGGHERGMRSGTLATHQCVGFGEAARIALEALVGESARIGELRDRLWNGIRGLGGVHRNGHPGHCIPGALNLAFEGFDGESLMAAMKDLALSTGSACNSASIEPSHVLRAIGLPESLALASLRFSVGRFTSPEDVDFAVQTVCRVVRGLRSAAA